MLKWCAKVKEIHEFFTIIKKELPEIKHQQQNLDLEHIEGLDYKREEPLEKRKPFEKKPLGAIINSKKYQQKLDWLGSLAKKVFQPNSN